MTRGLVFLCALAATLAVALPASASEGRTVKGVLVSVSATAVSVKDAKNAVTTCAVAAKSPSLYGFAAGDRVEVACLRYRDKLVLAKIRRLPERSGPASNDGGEKPKAQTGAGTISALSATSVTFHNSERDVTCSRTASSPALGDYRVGDQIKFGCLGGTLVTIAKTDSGRVDGSHKTVGASGTVSAVSSTSLTVHTDGGEVTCSVGDGSPSVVNVHVGDKVKIGCFDGVLKALTRSDSGTGTGDGHPATTVAGTLSALSTSSLTVHGEHGDVSCTVPATARLGDFHVGDRVGMACADGVLLKLVKL